MVSFRTWARPLEGLLGQVLHGVCPSRYCPLLFPLVVDYSACDGGGDGPEDHPVPGGEFAGEVWYAEHAQGLVLDWGRFWDLVMGVRRSGMGVYMQIWCLYRLPWCWGWSWLSHLWVGRFCSALLSLG